ncbi:Putative lipase ATG15 [Frankliniella fusca]|uniref:Lipase ATG15 n=1 Tax=Frankliniella fusca TaxID=407009 RepID=A0AAE1LTK8_9NEOP|nr:Putative lipase ATG15 [Frankliniella fusca]
MQDITSAIFKLNSFSFCEDRSPTHTYTSSPESKTITSSSAKSYKRKSFVYSPGPPSALHSASGSEPSLTFSGVLPGATSWAAARAACRSAGLDSWPNHTNSLSGVSSTKASSELRCSVRAGTCRVIPNTVQYSVLSLSLSLPPYDRAPHERETDRDDAYLVHAHVLGAGAADAEQAHAGRAARLAHAGLARVAEAAVVAAQVHDHPALEDAEEVARLVALHHPHLDGAAPELVVQPHGSKRGQDLYLRAGLSLPEVDDVALPAAGLRLVLDDVGVAAVEAAVRVARHGLQLEVLDAPHLHVAGALVGHEADGGALLLDEAPQLLGGQLRGLLHHADRCGGDDEGHDLLVCRLIRKIAASLSRSWGPDIPNMGRRHRCDKDGALRSVRVALRIAYLLVDLKLLVLAARLLVGHLLGGARAELLEERVHLVLIAELVCGTCNKIGN